jgi:hypothetical protein
MENVSVWKWAFQKDATELKTFYIQECYLPFNFMHTGTSHLMFLGIEFSDVFCVQSNE